MVGVKTFRDTFDVFDEDYWYASDFVLAATWNQTGWDRTYVTTTTPGEVTLTFDGTDLENKPFTGSEIQSNEFYSYGTYEVEMVASGESGVVSAFFLFTGEFFGASQHNEIDIEFLGGDTTVMNVNYFYGTEKLGNNGSIQVPLGFDAADGLHTYRIEWEPDAIRWYADDALLYEIESSTATVPIPDEPMKMYASVWTGADDLEHWHGPIDDNATAQASYSSVSYTPYTVGSSSTDGDSISFAGQTDALDIDLDAGTYMRAIRVLSIGDSLTKGVVNDADSAQLQEGREGYRLDLFEKIIAANGWIDYVGSFQNGPEGMLDKDHDGVPGKFLSAIVDDSTGTSDFTGSLEAYVPDVVLFMAGTNDFYNNGDDYFFANYFPSILSDISDAVDQFYDYAGNAEKYLVISTLPVKARGGVPVEYATFLNEGYSTVNSQIVLGDAGNGTYVPGIKAFVTSLKAQHPTLVLFVNPITEMEDISLDLIHFTDLGYQKYAEALFATLEAEIGLTNGDGFGNLIETLPSVDNVTGGEAGDRIGGNGNDNILSGEGGSDFLEGRGGADTLSGGADADVFAYGLDSLDGSTDTITDYSAADGDIISLGAIIDSFGWSEAEIAANVTVTDVSGGAQVTIVTSGGTYVVAMVEGVSAADVTISTTQFTQVFAEATERVGTDGDDILYGGDRSIPLFGLNGRDTLYGEGGDDVLSGGRGKDSLYGGAGADTFRYEATDLDGNRDQIEDFSIAEGDKVDLSAIATYYSWTAAELMGRLSLKNTSSGDLRFSINIPGGTQTFLLIKGVTVAAFLAADSLILTAGPPPDTGDDDGNLALLVPDMEITLGEETAVTVTLAGLDADAIAVVTVSAGGVTLTRTASADGDLVFDLSTLPDGPVTTSVTATDTGGNATTVAGPVLSLDTTFDDNADEDGNLTVTAPDTEITASEATTVSFTVSGIDADATAVVTVSDGSASVTSGTIASDGTVVLDLSGLANGALSVSITATDDSGNTATVAGPVLTLDTTFDDSADEDGNLTVTAPDTQITASEMASVSFVVSGIDVDATAVVTVSDGLTSVTSGTIASDGTVVLDLSGLADGALSVSITATDTSSNVTGGSGTTITLDSSEPPAPGTLIGTNGNDTLVDGDDATEILGLDGRDKLYGNGGNDTLEGGAGKDNYFGGAGADIFRFGPDALDGNRDEIEDFSIAQGDKVDLSGLGAAFGLDAVALFAALDFRDLSAGLRIGFEGTTFLLIKGVTENDFLAADALILAAGPPPDTGDDDGNLALLVPDTAITLGEETAVTVTLAGLDADATALITVSAGEVVLTRTASADGDLVFDLSTLPDGPVTTSVTATDTGGNATTVAGPALSLDTTVDDSADKDGNLTVTAPDTQITVSEVASVSFVVSGIDADATAVVTVDDGLTSVTSGTIASDGTVVLDLSGLADGALSVSVTATDTSSNVTGGSGTTIILDTSDEPPLPPDAIVGTEGNNTLKGSGSADMIFGLGGDDKLIGNGGDDIIFGGTGDDLLRGDNGNDTLEGGAGSDTLRGGDGADTFVFANDALDGSIDRVDGFSASEGDLVDIRSIVAEFGWTEAEASSFVFFSDYSGGVYMYLSAPEVLQDLADFRDITTVDIGLENFLLV